MTHAHTLVRVDDQFDPERQCIAGDCYVESLSLVLANIWQYPDIWPSIRVLAHSLLSVSHLVTRAVLSERLVHCVPSKPLPTPGFDDFITAGLKVACPTLAIEDDNPFFGRFDLPRHRDYNTLLGSDVVAAIRRTSVRVFPEYPDADTVGTYCAEYSCAVSAPWSFHPNPVLAMELGGVVAKRGLSARRTSATDAATILARVADDLRREACREYNLLRECQLFDISMPSIFTVALRESRHVDDVFRVASQMREAASDFRTWCRELDQADDPLEFLSGITEARDYLARFAKTIGSSREERIQITILPGFSIQLPSKASRSVELLLRRLESERRVRKPLAFLLNVCSTARTVRSLEPELGRVFEFSPSDARKIALMLERVPTMTSGLAVARRGA